MVNRGTLLCISLTGRPDNFGTRFHSYLYGRLGLNYLYKALTAKDAEAAVKGVRALSIRSYAVSMPFKESCIPSLDAIDPSAKVIDSVDTIVNNGGRLAGLNTDYIAVKSLIASHRLGTNARVMIQGNGGMGEAVTTAFRDTGFRDVIIAARSRQRGLAPTKQYGFQWRPLPKGIAAEILVNVTPLGMTGGAGSNTLVFSKAIVAQASVMFDMVTLPAETPLIRLTQQRGRQTISGTEVITLQAVEQFALYAGVRPGNALVAKASAFARSWDVPPGKASATSRRGYPVRKEATQTEK